MIKPHVAVAYHGRTVPTGHEFEGYISENLFSLTSTLPERGEEIARTRRAYVVYLVYLYGHHVGFVCRNKGCYVVFKAQEHAGHLRFVGHLLAVYPKVGAIIDAVEVEPHAPSAFAGRYGELRAEPIGVLKGVRHALNVRVLAKSQSAV